MAQESECGRFIDPDDGSMGLGASPDGFNMILTVQKTQTVFLKYSDRTLSEQVSAEGYKRTLKYLSDRNTSVRFTQTM